VDSLTVSVSQAPGGALVLRWELTADLARLRIPAATTPARADELWRHTCFEAFIDASGRAYCEFNFAPSGRWAAYAFDDYRSGMRPLELLEPPEIVRRQDDERLGIETDLALSGLPVLEGGGPLRLAVSAVIEDAGGMLSYWALVHPAAKADFHHRDSFVLELER